MKATVLFAGDFCTEHPERIVMGEGLRTLLQETDVSILNFEGPLQSSTPNHPNSHVLLQSDRSPQWCIDNHFSIVSLANNHINDFGEEGSFRTKNAFPEGSAIGLGVWGEAYSVKVISVKGLRIGISAVSSADLGSLKDEWSDSLKTGSAWINHPCYDRIIKDAKSQCDYLFVFAHAGIEYMPYPLPEWRDRYRSLIDMGADAVIATHPHIPQSFEEYKGHPIFYSLGNFYFDWFHESKKPEHWDDSLVVLLEIENGKMSYRIIPVSRQQEKIDITKSDSFKNYLNSISLSIDDTEYVDEVNKWVLKLFPKYYSWLLSGIGVEYYPNNNWKSSLKKIFRLFKPIESDNRIALHQMREESTRFLITRALKIMSNTRL